MITVIAPENQKVWNLSFHWKKVNVISFFVKFLSFVENGQKIAFLEGFRAFFKKCYEFLDFASFDSFKEVTSFASILLVFHRKSSRRYLWIL